MADDALTPDLRSLVASLVRSAVRDIHAERTQPNTPPETDSGPSRFESVRMVSDADLQAFAVRMLAAFENPKARDDVRAGRLRFRLVGTPAGRVAPMAVKRVERGAVTERAVAEAAAEGLHLVLGPKAVLTPLAREKAKAMGLVVEKERT